jgi:hypothetical protein
VELRFYIDPVTGEPHIYRHKVSEEEVEDVLRRPGEDRPGDDGLGLQSGRQRPGGT